MRLIAGETCVEFSWAGDRWQHVVAIPAVSAPTAPSRRRSLWHSVEGPITLPVDPRRPASPVLTDVSLLGPPSAPTAIVGVGHAGCGHCSLEATVDPADSGAVRFQVACRLTAPWPGLGSTYRLVEEGRPDVPLATVAARTDERALATAPQTVVWTYRVGPAGLVIVAGATLCSVAGPQTAAGPDDAG